MSVIVPCPWCDGTRLDWAIPPYSRYGRPECEDCGARGPNFLVPPGPRDRAQINGLAIEAWNGSRS